MTGSNIPQSAYSYDEHICLWAQLGNVPVDDAGLLEESFLDFNVGVDREEVWRWFEQQNPRISVVALMGIADPINKGPTYNHAFTFAFEVSGSRCKNGEDVTPAALKEALLERLNSFPDIVALAKAIGGAWDTHEES